MIKSNVYVFDGEYKDGGGKYFFEQLHELMPNEREEIIQFIKNQDKYAFEMFKKDCKLGRYSHIKVNSPRKHTLNELKEIKEDLMFFLFDELLF